MLEQLKNIDRMFVSGKHYDSFYKEFPVAVGIDGLGILDNGVFI